MFAMICEAYLNMTKLSQTKSNHQNHKNQSQLTKFDFLGFLTDCALTDDFKTLNPWEIDFKWCPKLYELLIIDHGAQIPQEWPPSIALTDSWLF